MDNNSHPAEGKPILYVEDDADLREAMIEYLEKIGHRVTGVGTAKAFYEALSGGSYALAIIDIGLPDQSGLVVADHVRKNTDMRIIMLTAHSTLDDKIGGYQSGADIYMTKPVDCRELSAAITSMFERMPSPLLQTNQNTVQSSSWRLMKSDWVLRSPSNIPIQLTSKEYELIMFLIKRNSEVVSRTEILKHLDYPYNEYGSLALKALIYRLRKKIDEAGCTFPVKTIHGTGYALSTPISII